MPVAVTKAAILVLALAAGGVYAMHMEALPAFVGIAIALSLIATLVPRADEDDVGARHVSRRASIAIAALISALGLAMVWTTNTTTERPAHIIHDLAWAQVALAGWLTYASAVGSSSFQMVHAQFDAAARARWREGDVAFCSDLASRILVVAQPSWAALVIETAWPEPRPKLVTDLVAVMANANMKDIASFRARMQDKGGTDLAEARWELARIACDVVREAHARPRDDIGGTAVARLVVAAARVVRDDEDAIRLFAALVLPAVARRA